MGVPRIVALAVRNRLGVTALTVVPGVGHIGLTVETGGVRAVADAVRRRAAAPR